MATKKVIANKGLTVKINLFSLDKNTESFNSEQARLCIKGQALNLLTNEKKMFNDAGQLITALGKWNSAQLQALRKAKKDA